MKKFKTIFYPIYVVVIILVLIISFNLYESLEVIKRWGWYRYLTDLPKLGRVLLVLLCILMLVELVAENIHLFRWRGKASQFEKQVLDLKAKLYDKLQRQEVVPEEITEVEHSEEEDLSDET